jgi:hypothetical protein
MCMVVPVRQTYGHIFFTSAWATAKAKMIKVGAICPGPGPSGVKPCFSTRTRKLTNGLRGDWQNI